MRYGNESYMTKINNDRSIELKPKCNNLSNEWCILPGLSAVRRDSDGQKIVVMTIADAERAYPCTQFGMEKAYRYAKASNDEDMVARTSAMFEIETLREDMELQNEDIKFAQICPKVGTSGI